jgi:hypothetical protein
MVVIDTQMEYAYLRSCDSVVVEDHHAQELLKQVFENTYGTREEFIQRLQQLPNFQTVFAQDIDIYRLGKLKSMFQEIALSILFKLVEEKLFVDQHGSGRNTFDYFALNVNPQRTILMSAVGEFDASPNNGILGSASF